ncbi:Protein MCM10-like protein [Aphelenchoides fujianensis]|nr:Protein MCM10-like protein [Aphelenchoides fujianensis]
MIIGGAAASSSSSSSSFPLNDSDFSRVKSATKSENAGPASVFDPFFTIKVSNPRFPLETFNVYCKELQKVRLNSMGTASGSAERVVMAVVVESSGMKKAASGNGYILWQISDLVTDTKVKVLLFGDAAQAHWKIPPGFVVALTNPEVAADTPGSGGKSTMSTLKINKSLQVLSLGSCPDFATCKGVKKNGERCTNYVNAALSPFCSYHIQNEAKKLRAGRGAFSAIANERPKCAAFPSPPKAQPSGVVTVSRPKTTLQSNQVRYTTGDRALVAARGRLGHRAVMKVEEMKEEKENKAIFPLINNRLLASASKPTTAGRSPSGSNSLKDFIDKRTKTEVTPTALRPGGSPFVARPALGPKLVELASPQMIQPKPRFSTAEEAARKKAAEIFKKSLDTDGKPPKRKAPLNDSTDEKKLCLTPAKFSTDRIREMLNKKSTHEHEVLQASRSREEKYFNEKEIEEKVEIHATTMFEQKDVSVVSCKSCGYTATHLAQRCFELQHEFVRHKADKRFFKCKECQTRTFCFGLMPTRPCAQCLCKDYERVAARDERKIEIREKLLLRGEERKFVHI